MSLSETVKEKARRSAAPLLVEGQTNLGERFPFFRQRPDELGVFLTTAAARGLQRLEAGQERPVDVLSPGTAACARESVKQLWIGARDVVGGEDRLLSRRAERFGAEHVFGGDPRARIRMYERRRRSPRAERWIERDEGEHAAGPRQERSSIDELGCFWHHALRVRSGALTVGREQCAKRCHSERAQRVEEIAAVPTEEPFGQDDGDSSTTALRTFARNDGAVHSLTANTTYNSDSCPPGACGVKPK